MLVQYSDMFRPDGIRRAHSSVYYRASSLLLPYMARRVEKGDIAYVNSGVHLSNI